jgi:hypothetical protein
MTKENLTKKDLLKMIESFEHYPAVTQADDKAFILAYLDDEACSISEEEIKNYISNFEITTDNIQKYYQFMSDEDLEKHGNILSDVFQNRLNYLFKNLKFKDDEYHIFLCKYTLQKLSLDRWIKSSLVFEVKDTLKPIDEYLEEIKKSDTYKDYKKSIFLKNGKTKAASNVLQLLDKDYDYKIALQDTLRLFDVTKEDLELELDIYI